MRIPEMFSLTINSAEGILIPLVGLALLAGIAIGYGLVLWKQQRQKSRLAQQEQAVLENARREGEALLRESRLIANEEVVKLREQTEQSFAKRRQEIEETEKRLAERETLINRQLEGLVREDHNLREQKLELQKATAGLKAEHEQVALILTHRKEELARLARLNEGEARTLLLKEVEQESLRDAGELSRRIIEGAKARAEEEARRIISVAIQRYAGEHTFETTSSTITLPNEEIKGRIIGREGRNIRSFESASGVTVLIDDTPNAVVLSSFDPVRREVARESMQRLILDGRIHPTRIEEVVAKVKEEIDEAVVRAGEEALFKTGLGPLHSEVVKLLGRLRFRQSYAQNLLDHSVEVAQLCGLMAGELGLNATIARRAGLLHDIGKAVPHEIEGTHAIVGADFLKRHGEPEEVVNGVASHHDEVPHTGPWGILVSAADAISASRPGARSETMTTYLKRVEKLEQIGLSFPGVEKCFAVQAGRELRVMVQPEQVDDDQAYGLARSIARKIEDELQYPGQIRVTVIRETRSIEFAK
jgi:ribonucrease Y